MGDRMIVKAIELDFTCDPWTGVTLFRVSLKVGHVTPSKETHGQNHFCLDVTRNTSRPWFLLPFMWLDCEVGDWRGNCTVHLTAGHTKRKSKVDLPLNLTVGIALAWVLSHVKLFDLLEVTSFLRGSRIFGGDCRKRERRGEEGRETDREWRAERRIERGERRVERGERNRERARHVEKGEEGERLIERGERVR
ncbi:hypothetical protein TNCV_507021 [Trichonephila clavipes]|nr:hypothetical protein TNCV_507021 [Trichonephila clavipes]